MADYSKNIKINITTNENKLYFSDLVFSSYYNEFLKNLEFIESLVWYDDTNEKNNYISTNRHLLFKYLENNYPYSLILDNNYINKIKKNNVDNKLITKYNPLSENYYSIHELFTKFKLFDKLKNNDSIIYIGNSLSLLEYINYNKYNFKFIHNILTASNNNFTEIDYLDLLDSWNKNIKNISSIYNTNITNYNNAIHDIIDYNFNNIVKKK